ACSSRRIFSGRDEAGFPVASQSACRLQIFRGLRAQDRASTDALRPFKHRLNIPYQHELSLIRRTFAQFPRRLSTKGRSSSALQCRGREASEKNILAAYRCIFWKRPAGQKSRGSVPQWFATTIPAGAQ